MKFPVSGLSLLRTILLGITVLILLQPEEVSARVGVTSATDGDPTGKPPSEAERVLRMGVDVQANEVITTKVDDRAHLVFLDGTSLTIGPNARVVIDKFVYDPSTKTGDLALTASKGVFRLVGGKISKTNTVTITTPSSTIGIRGGITIVEVHEVKTVATFVFGVIMTVTGHNSNDKQNVGRPGMQVTTLVGGSPGRATPVNLVSLSGQLGQLEGGSKNDGSTSKAGALLTEQAAPSLSNQNSNSGTNTGTDQTTLNSNSTIIPQTTTAPTVQASLAPITPYVNGAPSTVAALSTLNQLNATAFYVGQVSGSVNGNPNTVTGIYSNLWSFGNRSGVATVRFDGSTYGGGTTANTFMNGNGPAFGTTAPLPHVSGLRPTNVLTLSGSFTSSSTDPAKNQSGIFSVTGNAYQATGTFNAKK